MKICIRSLTAKAAYLVASLIILAALVVCTIRLLTPILDKHRSDFENIASEFLQTPVVINKVRVSWYQYQPVITLRSVTILNQDSKKPVFTVKKASLLISVFKSLAQWRVVTSGIMISGAEVNVNQAASGELTIKEFSTLPFNQQANNNAEAKFTEIMAWLSNEPYLVLNNIDIYYTGIGKKPRFVTLNKLSFENANEEHKIAGKAILHQEIPTEVAVAIQWTGKVSDIPNVKARGYACLSGFSLSQWAKGMSYQGWQINKGIVSAKFWLDWDQGQWQKIQANVQSYGLALFSETKKFTQYINRFSGNLGWKRDGNRQIIAGDDILLDLPNRLWPVSGFNLVLQADEAGSLAPVSANITYFNLADLQPILFSWPNLVPDETQRTLTQHKPQGGFYNTVINFASSWKDLKQLTFATRFSDFSVAATKQYPGVENLNGSVEWKAGSGNLKLNSANTRFQYQTLFKKPIFADQLTGELQLIEDKDRTLLLKMNAVQMLNADMALNLNGNLSLPAQGSPKADLNANLTMKSVKNIMQYMPAGIFEKGLNTWLGAAFLSGELISSRAVLRGNLADFPFDKGEGEFNITSKVKNVSLRFAPDWPLLERINAEVIFSGRQMAITVDSAETMGIAVGKVKAAIPYFGNEKPQVIDVKTSVIKSDFTKGMEYVHASPLQQKIGKMFKDAELRGGIALTLGLSIPLGNPDEAKVQGDLVMLDGSMNLVPWDLQLSQLNGQLRFTENSITAKDLRARLFNKPLQFDLTTVEKSKSDAIVRVSFSNQFDFMDIENWLKLPLSTVIKGKADIEGRVDLSLTSPILLHLRSNLLGTSISLPDQYGKSADQRRAFTADLVLQENQPLRIKLQYAGIASAALLVSRREDNYVLPAATLHFGSGLADWPASEGLYVTGNFNTLDWEKIKPLLNEDSGNKAMPSLALKAVDIAVQRVILGAQILTQARLQVQPDKDQWKIQVSSNELTGQITAAPKLKKSSQIQAVFQKINLKSSGSAGSLPKLDIKTLPALDITADDVKIDGMPIGKLVFNATPSDRGMSINRLQINSRNMNLQAKGEWQQTGKTQATSLRGYIKSPNVSRLLSSFGMDVKNFISSTGDLSFNLGWSDALYAPALATMAGHASLQMGAGRIVDIGENGRKMDIGKMLSVFSLQTIPRRLSLDFSDLFQKGYTFDSLSGDFSLQKGELQTSNMRFDGPVAKIGINGKIGLTKKDYDFILSVAANVTSSIPVAATLLTGNPLIGLGAFAVNTVLGSKVSTYYYAVTGPWSNPVWKQVKSGS